MACIFLCSTRRCRSGEEAPSFTRGNRRVHERIRGTLHAFPGHAPGRPPAGTGAQRAAPDLRRSRRARPRPHRTGEGQPSPGEFSDARGREAGQPYRSVHGAPTRPPGNQYTGGPHLPRSAEYPGERIASLMEGSGAGIVLPRGRLRSSRRNLSGTGARAVPLGDAPRIPHEGVRIHQSAEEVDEQDGETGARPDGLACIICTSDGIGKPKGVTSEHKSIATQTGRLRDLCGADDTAISPQKAPKCFAAVRREILAPARRAKGVTDGPGTRPGPAAVIDTVVPHGHHAAVRPRPPRGAGRKRGPAAPPIAAADAQRRREAPAARPGSASPPCPTAGRPARAVRRVGAAPSPPRPSPWADRPSAPGPAPCPSVRRCTAPPSVYRTPREIPSPWTCSATPPAPDPRTHQLRKDPA